MIRKIRDLLYDQGFTISGARNRLHEIVQIESDKHRNGEVMLDGLEVTSEIEDSSLADFASIDDFADSDSSGDEGNLTPTSMATQRLQFVRRELFEIRDLLGPGA